MLGLEIGSFEGQSSCWFLENWVTHPKSRLICVDTWGGGLEHQNPDYNFREIEDRFDENVKPYGNKVVKVKSTSTQALLSLIFRNIQVDFVYVDGGHTSKDVLQDLVLAHYLLKPEGLVVCDDYLWTSPSVDYLDQPKLGIDAFTQVYSREITPLVLPSRVVGWLKK